MLDAIGASEGCAGGAWPEAGRRRVAVGGDERVADDERPHVHAEGRPERFVACSGDERAADDEPPAPTQLDTSREESVYGAHAAGQADAAPHAAPRGPSDLTRDVPPHPDLDDLKQPQAPLACSASSTLRDTGTHPQHDAAAPKWPSGPRAAPEPRAKAPSPAPEPPPPETAKFDPIETRILALLSPSPIDENHLIRSINLPPATLAPALLSLELSGHITRLRGGQIALA
ncbi:MAG: hypothetical protein Q4F71_05315 [Paracoccus sp. (in: a-proteobacteria)]|nr:hypothetical protein [Paracoccus sp. (in: a-proteobacteria)]